MKDASGDVRIDPDGMWSSAEALYNHRQDTFKPEVERIRGILLDGIESEARHGSAVQSLGAPGEPWSGSDFGAVHDANANKAVELLDGFVDGYLAFAYNAAGAAESYDGTDVDAALNIQRVTDGDHK